MLSVFPTLQPLQQMQNAIAVGQIIPRAIDKTDLKWTYLGFADDTPGQRLIRPQAEQSVRPGGLHLDGRWLRPAALFKRGIAGASEAEAILEMGGSHGPEQRKPKSCEASVRGFWKAYRSNMGIMQGHAMTDKACTR